MPLLIAIGILLLATVPSSSFAEGNEEGLVFYLERGTVPTVKLDRIPSRTAAIDAILAMYSLQNGAGCEGQRATGFYCLLPSWGSVFADASRDGAQLVPGGHSTDEWLRRAVLQGGQRARHIGTDLLPVA
jgi:hypothetical protein